MEEAPLRGEPPNFDYPWPEGEKQVHGDEEIDNDEINFPPKRQSFEAADELRTIHVSRTYRLDYITPARRPQ